MKKGAGFALIFLLGVFLYGLNLGSAYSNLVNFGAEGVESWCNQNHISSNYGGSYCYGYFGISNGQHNDVCACNEGNQNKIVCCASAGSNRPSNERGVYICPIDSYSYSNAGHSISCSQPCSANYWQNDASPSECNSTGFQTLSATCIAGSCGTGCTVGARQVASTSSCTYLDNPYFSTLSAPNTNISTANNGDTVLLRFPGVNLVNVSFNVQSMESIGWQNLWGLLGRDWNSFLIVSNTAAEPYKIMTTNTRRLNASADQTTWKQSDNLTVSGSSDSNPDAHIILPTCKNWSAGYNISFTQDSTDEDDLLKITWNFGDGNTYVVNNYSTALNSTKADTTHNYSTAGNYEVVLNAEEMTRSKYDSDSVRLLILQEGINVVPVITSPAPGFNAEANQDITFDASQTYVVDCSNSLTSFNFTTCDGLRCRYVHAPSSNIGQNLSGYTLLFNWTMGDGKFCDGSAPTYCGGNWSSLRDVSQFTWRYQSAGRKNINLRVIYDD